MRSRAGLSAGLVSLAFGWAVNHVYWAKPAFPQPVQLSTNSPAPRSIQVRKKSAPPPAACTAYNPPNPKSAGNDENASEAFKLIDQFNHQLTEGIAARDARPPSLEYMIALVPDPRHTHLSMLFDRSVDSIEDAAQDEGFTYDSSWLPWRVAAQTYNSRSDELAAKESIEARETCPGVILFRKSVTPETSSDDPYVHGLVVFVVGEQPTRGLNSKQWDFAVSNISRYGKDASKPLRVLGPTFSGTLPSLLRKLPPLPKDSPQNAAPTVYVFSGTVGSCQSVQWFQKNVQPNTRFGVFQENDDLQLHRFFDYLVQQGEELTNVAIVSEDETAYGGAIEDLGTNNVCDAWFPAGPSKRPVMLFYPRDISALRAAYQAQSIFSRAPSPSEAKLSPRTVLSDNLQSDDNEQGDTPLTYSKGQIAMTEEAELYGLVTFLRAHHTHYIALRGSNPLDYVFLTRFLHRAFPEGRVVTVGSEILLTRELDTTEFRGSMALTNFSLLPRLQHWSQLFVPGRDTKHAHRVFSGNHSEGIYLASRFLITSPDQPQNPVKIPTGGHLRVPLKPAIPDFADPYWLHLGENLVKTAHSNTWLTVLGRGGYWPVAMLNPNVKNPPSTQAEVSPAGGYYDITSSMGMKPPMSWFFAICLSFLFVGWHVLSRRRFRGTSSAYVSNPCSSHGESVSIFLVAVTTALAFATSFLLIAPFRPLWALQLWESSPVSYILFFPLSLLLFGAIIVHKKFGWPVLIGALCSSAILFTLVDVNNANNVAYYWRAIHLSNSVSPLLPLLLLLAGFYVWGWQSLVGNTLLGEERPLLPDLGEPNYRAGKNMADRVDFVARPLTRHRRVMAVLAIAALLCVFCFRENFPILSFEGTAFRWIINLSLLAVLLLIAEGSARLFFTWKELKRLLVQLAHMRLSRTLYALKDISVRSLWQMSGHVPRTQYDFFARQMDAARRLNRRLWVQGETGALTTALEKMIETGQEFANSYLENLECTVVWRDLIRQQVANCAGLIMRDLLEKEWGKEVPTFDCLVRQPQSPKEESKTDEKAAQGPPPVSTNPKVVAAEEFICLLYISYIQNILARMRTMVYSMSALYVSAMLALAFYPFAPRPSIALWMLFLLIGLGGVVAVVYVGLERDQILSYITNTDQRLGWEFWGKYATFLLPPVLALLTAQFPEIAESVLQWIQPGLDAVK